MGRSLIFIPPLRRAPLLWFHLLFASKHPQMILPHSSPPSSCRLVQFFYFLSPSPICCLFAQANLCSFDSPPPFVSLFILFYYFLFLLSLLKWKILLPPTERPPDDPEPVMFVQSYPYPSVFKQIKRSNWEALSKRSSLSGSGKLGRDVDVCNQASGRLVFFQSKLLSALLIASCPHVWQ